MDAAVGSFGGGNAKDYVVYILRTIGNYIPLFCGTGGLTYGGDRLSGAVAAVGFYGIAAADSRTGSSKGGFGDITFGEGIQGGYGYAAYTDGSTEHFAFFGAGEDAIVEKVSVGAYGSHVSGESLFRNQFGFNVDIGTLGAGAGIGGGIDTDSLTSCVDPQFQITSMIQLAQLVLDFFIFALGVTLLQGAIRGGLYPASRGGHHFRRPTYLRSMTARATAFIGGLVLMIWLVFRLWRLI